MDIKSKIKMNDGHKIPRLGYGTWLLTEDNTEKGVSTALNNGYIHIDTAQMYNNEYDIGKVLKSYDRDKIFITSKVWTENFKKYTTRSILESLRRLDIKYLDLMLLHRPDPKNQEYTYKAYSELMEARSKGLTKSIGVSNFSIDDLQKIYDKFGEWPSVNQFIMSLKLQSDELVQFCKQKNIVIEGYSLLRILFKSKDDPKYEKHFKRNTGTLKEKEIKYLDSLSKKHNKTVAQIILRWAIQRDFVIFPKSIKEQRIKENADIFNFSLTDDEIISMNNMSEGSNDKQNKEKMEAMNLDYENGFLYDKHF